MRVTQNMLSNTILNNISASYGRIEKYQAQLASGKINRRPSDDPAAVNKSLSFRSSVKEIEQYARNVDDSITWLSTADVSMRNATELMYRAKELAVMGANGTLGQSELNKIANEVDSIVADMVNIGNANVAGRYIFSGQRTTTAPFTQVSAPAPAVNYNGDGNTIDYDIGKGATIKVNLAGNTVFKGATDVFQVLLDLGAHLRAGNFASVSASTSLIDNALDAITDSLAVVGARLNRLDFANDRHMEDSLNLTEILSSVEDADFAEVVVRLKAEENVYQSALMTGSMSIQKSLIDFLR
ncbi:MAG: flagellar hook-associated protein FlgL [Actinobacteria bacterium]|jgi:flagellar hook-associated protein 3 FlgL|nr:flagellar hook-associated protein FlgL [Actinomycetota bacterium]